MDVSFQIQYISVCLDCLSTRQKTRDINKKQSLIFKGGNLHQVLIQLCAFCFTAERFVPQGPNCAQGGCKTHLGDQKVW